MTRNASPKSPLIPALIPSLSCDDEDELVWIGGVFDEVDDDANDADDADASPNADADADSVEVSVTVIVLVTVSVAVLLIGVVDPDVRL